MESLDIFYQGQGIREIEYIEIRPDHTVAMIKAILFEKHSCEADTLIFIEDHDAPLDDQVVIGAICGAAGLKMHLHRCRHVAVEVSFAGETVRHTFAPGTTVARVKHWAAVGNFGMTEEEAGEHHLQISGTQDRPAPGTHIGSLTSCPDCQARFDLVPDHRINGAPA